MADAIQAMRDGNDDHAFSDDTDVILNSNQVHDNWMQCWLVEESETDCDFEGFLRRMGFQQLA